MWKKINLLILSSVVSAAAWGDYAVVVSRDTYHKAAWKTVADALVKKHDATLIQYSGNVESALPKLKKIFPKYTCFVATPEEAGFDLTVKIHRLTRQFDSDPYGDTLWGIVTGYTPADALRMAQATEPQVVGRALLSAGMGAERWREARFIDTGKPGTVGTKLADGTVTREKYTGDITPYWVQAWNETDPEALITSGHASQRNLEMPFSRGNIVCREGKLYGYVAQERLINKEGYARKEKVKGKLIPLKAPTQPKLLFAVGNCLIGDIPDRNCMALAMMGFGKVNQMIGYTVTTWYGQAGWGVLRYWEQMGGTAPLNEAFYFNNVEMIHRLDQIDSRLPTLNWKVGKRDLTQMYLNKTLQKTRHGKPISRDTLGLCHDRDVVAFYGDPALEIRLDPRATLSGRRTISLSEKKGIWTATIHALADHPTPTSSSTPIGILFPHRLKNIKLLSGAEYNPLFADNFLLVTAPGPFKAGMDYKITFTAKN